MARGMRRRRRYRSKGMPVPPAPGSQQFTPQRTALPPRVSLFSTSTVRAPRRAPARAAAKPPAPAPTTSRSQAWAGIMRRGCPGPAPVGPGASGRGAPSPGAARESSAPASPRARREGRRPGCRGKSGTGRYGAGGRRFHGSEPWVTASVKMTQSPALQVICLTNSWCASPRRRAAGQGKLPLWLPGTRHRPPSPWLMSVSWKATTVRPLCILPSRTM